MCIATPPGWDASPSQVTPVHCEKFPRQYGKVCQYPFLLLGKESVLPNNTTQLQSKFASRYPLLQKNYTKVIDFWHVSVDFVY